MHILLLMLRLLHCSPLQVPREEKAAPGAGGGQAATPGDTTPGKGGGTANMDAWKQLTTVTGSGAAQQKQQQGEGKEQQGEQQQGGGEAQAGGDAAVAPGSATAFVTVDLRVPKVRCCGCRCCCCH